LRTSSVKLYLYRKLRFLATFSYINGTIIYMARTNLSLYLLKDLATKVWYIYNIVSHERR